MELRPHPIPAWGTPWAGAFRSAPPPGQLLQRGTGLRGGNTKERARSERAAEGLERPREPEPRSRCPRPLLPARQPPARR